MHIDNKSKNILVLCEGPTQGLDNTTITAEDSESGKRFVLRLHYNGGNSFMFVNAVNMCQFKVKDPEIKQYPLCLGNISKDFILNNMKRRTGLKGNNFFFC